jgi:hypothetical protein
MLIFFEKTYARAQDERLLSVSKNYAVMVSKRVSVEKNYLCHVLTLSDKVIFKPDDNAFWPGQANLEWHREKKFNFR